MKERLFHAAFLVMAFGSVCQARTTKNFAAKSPPVVHDLAPVSIDTPAVAVVPPSVPFHPAATFQNQGQQPESNFYARALIKDSLGLTVYEDSILLFSSDSLLPESLVAVVFPSPFIPQPMSGYLMAAITLLAGDENPANDTVSSIFATFPSHAMLWGMVDDDNQGGAPLAGALVTAFSALFSCRETTGIDGQFSFDSLVPGTYTVNASRQGYVDSSLSLGLMAGSQTFVAISLGYPVPVFIPQDSLTAVLPPNSVDSSHTILISNAGTRPLVYQLYWPARDSRGFGDSLWGLDLEAATSDNLCLGVELLGDHIWVTGGGSSPGSDPNYLYRLNRQGQLETSYLQPSTVGFGWRDLCHDGQYLYASEDSAIVQIDPATGQPTGMVVPGPTSPCRGLAYDPASDHFFVANFQEDIREIDRVGQVLNDWPNALEVFGLAWDPDPDGPWLWTSSRDPSGDVLVSRFDPGLGVYSGVSFVRPTIDPANASAGGVAFSSDLISGRGLVVCLLQDMSDRLVGCEVRPDNCPWLDLDPQSGTLLPGGNDSIRLYFDNRGLDSTIAYSAKIILHMQIPPLAESLSVIMLTTTGVGFEPGPDPGRGRPALFPCRPNPARGAVHLDFYLPQEELVSLGIYNASGQFLREVSAGRLPRGIHSALWDGRDGSGRAVAPGVYFVRLLTRCGLAIRKTVFLK